jgi:hypothetical protein
MSQTNETFNPFDPAGMFKGMRDANMDAWSRMMIQFVNTDAYAQATGALLDAWLSTSAPFRKALEAAMTRVLADLNMPARTDVIGLAERLTNSACTPWSPCCMRTQQHPEERVALDMRREQRARH